MLSAGDLISLQFKSSLLLPTGHPELFLGMKLNSSFCKEQRKQQRETKQNPSEKHYAPFWLRTLVIRSGIRDCSGRWARQCWARPAGPIRALRAPRPSTRNLSSLLLLRPPRIFPVIPVYSRFFPVIPGLPPDAPAGPVPAAGGARAAPAAAPRKPRSRREGRGPAGP